MNEMEKVTSSKLNIKKVPKTESTKSQLCSNYKHNGKTHENLGHNKSSTTLYPKYSPPVLIPSVSQNCQLPATPYIGDNILHPELIISPRSGEAINRRGIYSLGRRRKLIIGSIDNDKCKGKKYFWLIYF